MTRLGKFPIYVMLLAIAAIAAGLFGMLHNQVSYTVGPTYFTGLKFDQFAIADALPERIGAAMVGWQASWWMGPLVAFPAYTLGLVLVPTARSYLAAGLSGLIVVVGTATVFAALGLIAALAVVAGGVVDGHIPTPTGVDEADFVRAGFMHEASYLGGAVGAVLALWPMIRARRIDKATAPQQGEADATA